MHTQRGEQPEANCRHCQSGRTENARAKAVRKAATDRRNQRNGQRYRRQQQPGGISRKMAQILKIERQEETNGEEREEAQQAAQVGGGEKAVVKEAQIDDWLCDMLLSE